MSGPRISRGISCGGLDEHREAAGYPRTRINDERRIGAILPSVAGRKRNHHKAVDGANRPSAAAYIGRSRNDDGIAGFPRSGGRLHRPQDRRHLPGMLTGQMRFVDDRSWRAGAWSPLPIIRTNTGPPLSLGRIYVPFAGIGIFSSTNQILTYIFVYLRIFP